MRKYKTMVFLIFSIILFNYSYGQLWKQYVDSARIYESQKNVSKAIEFYNKVEHELKKDSAETGTYASYSNYLGSLYLDKGEYEKAEWFYLEAKRIRGKIFGERDPLYGSSCFNLGLVYKRLNNYEKSEFFYLKAKEIEENSTEKDSLFYARICNNLGNLYSTLGQYEKAENLLIESRQIRKKLVGENDPAYSQSLFNLAALYADMNQHLKALPFLTEAKQIRENKFGRVSVEFAQICDNLGRFYADIGQFKKAEPIYIEALEIWEKVLTRKHPFFIKACNNLSALYMRTGEYEEAEPLLLEAKTTREQSGNKDIEYTWSCNNLGELYKILGQYEKAEPLFIEAKQIREKLLGTKDRWYASACENLGNLYHNMRLYEKALPLHLEAKRIRENNEVIDLEAIAFSCSNIANVYSATNRYKEADSLYNEARKLIKEVKGELSLDYADNSTNLAQFYMEQDQFEKAEPLFIEAMEIREKVVSKEHPSYIENCLNLAGLYWNVKKYEKALEYFEKAWSLQSNQVKKIFAFTNESEKQSYLKENAKFETIMLSFDFSAYLPSKGFSYNVALFNRNLILSSLQQLRHSIYDANDSIVKNRFDLWLNIREQLSFWLAQPVETRPGYVKDLEEQTNDLEKDLTRFSSEFKKQKEQKQITWKNIQGSLKPQEAAIEFIEFKYYNGKRSTDSTYYIALLLRKDKPDPELIRLFEKKQLDSLFVKTGNRTKNDNITAFYRGIKVKDRGSVSTSRPAYRLIWESIENRLKGITKIYFTPAGLLHRISFAALPMNGTQVLSDKYQLVQLSTTASIVEEKNEFVTSSDKINLYGGIKYDIGSGSSGGTIVSENHWNYLPGTADEVKKIKGLGKQNIILSTGIAATEESVKALDGKESPAVLHIATHGFFIPDPQTEKQEIPEQVKNLRTLKQMDNPLFRSGLLLAGANNKNQDEQAKEKDNGILTSYEVSNLYLPNTKLVVLSACETGLGDIEGSEGVYGLQRAFKMAGVQNLVMSLWKVPDAETVEFMENFYKGLFARQTISTAFNHARSIMKNKYRREPYKWAAWVLVQ